MFSVSYVQKHFCHGNGQMGRQSFPIVPLMAAQLKVNIWKISHSHAP